MRFKQDKGVAGLTILLSVIVMLFIIGLIVMIFTLMGSELSKASYTTTSTTATNQSVARTGIVGAGATLSTLRDVSCGTITAVFNGTGGVAIAVGNFTQTNCLLKNTSSMATYGATNLLVSYPYTYEADNTGTTAINDTTTAIAGATSWFSIFIVITAMVVLILLVVIIVVAIRGSGMLGGEDGGVAPATDTA